MALDPRAARGPYQPVARHVDPASGQEGAIEGATAAEFAQNRFGGPTRVQSTSVTLSTTFGQILGGNPRRVFWTIINRGTTDVGIDTDPASSQATGILLAAGGGYASMDVTEDGESVAWPVYGASASGTPQVRILEVMRV
jgi:hypothetical protein